MAKIAISGSSDANSSTPALPLWRELRFCNEIVIFYFNGYDILQQQQQPYLSSHHHTQQDGLAGWAAALHWGDKWQEKGLIKQV